MFEETRKLMKQLGLPEGDRYDLPSSPLKFPDGAHFRTEVSTINSLEVIEGLLERAEDIGVTVNRVGETYGIFRHRDTELKEMLELCSERGVELNLSVGPRATYDVSATARTAQGAMLGYRLRGMEQILRAVEVVKRAARLGCRGITLYDEGLLWVLHRMKTIEALPEELQLKISAHAGHGNPAAFLLLERSGANTINPVRDLGLPMLAALRQSVSAPLDIHSDNLPSSGGFVRTYEVPEIIRICSPVYIKSGNVAVPAHGQRTTAMDGKHMVEQLATVMEHIQRYAPNAVQSPAGSGPALPIKPTAEC